MTITSNVNCCVLPLLHSSLNAACHGAPRQFPQLLPEQELAYSYPD